jgi:hypothetical protein
MTRFAMRLLQEPGAESRISDLRLIAPKARFEFALDSKMIQLKLNGFETCREMATDIALAYEQSDDVAASVLRSDHHGPPLLSPRLKEGRGTCR